MNNIHKNTFYSKVSFVIDSFSRLKINELLNLAIFDFSLKDSYLQILFLKHL
jgi:hypothetical protein